MTISLNKKDLSRIVEAAIGLVALVIGGLIYIRYRNESLLMFDWFQELRISNIIGEYRVDVDKSSVYEWVKYNMPAGLWLFSYMFIIDSLWGNDNNAVYRCFLYVLPIMALVSELMQLFKILPGTYDFMDLFSYVLAILLFIIIKKL
jgi:hypothetical protein